MVLSFVAGRCYAYSLGSFFCWSRGPLQYGCFESERGVSRIHSLCILFVSYAAGTETVWSTTRQMSLQLTVVLVTYIPYECIY